MAVIYGPSGSGKSSLVRAGLLPYLADYVTPVVVEASPVNTERDVQAALAKHFPDLPFQRDVTASVRSLRQHMGSLPGRKVLIVIDQFEQCVQADPLQNDHPLIQALRQCDRARVQCLVIVRDDFWTSVSRFMQQLDIPLTEHDNAAAIEPFDQRHATRVLTEFGRATGCLSADAGELSRSERTFLERAVTELAAEGRVNPVQLATFFEIMKSRPWTLASLRRIGGSVGVGVRFLEESFSSPAAPKANREHEAALRAILAATLPAPGNSIKGPPRSVEYLREVSGYRDRPADFQRTLEILARDTRLLTLVATKSDGDDSSLGDQSAHHFQLTHDFLIPSLRQWLAERQLESARGRATLKLTERAAWWDAQT